LGSFGIGIFGSLISSLFSSLRSYFIRPIELIREKDSSQGFRDLNALFVSSAITGVIFCLVGLGIGFIPAPKSLLPGLLGVGLVIFGFILIFPLALISFIQLILNTIDRFFFWPTFRIAWEEIKLEPLQNTLTSATILLASSLVLTLTSLTDSYEKTLVRWVDDDNPFDFSIINASKLASGLPGVPLELLKTLEKNSNIQKLEPFIIKTKFPVQDNFYTLHVYPFESKENEIIVSTNFCYLENKCQGDWVEIQTEKEGKINFYIKGEKEHFFSERGTIMMNFENYQKYFSNSKLNSIRVSFFTTVTPEKKVSYLETEIKAYGGELKLLDQASLKSLYLEGMRSVFSILETLKISAVIISFLALLTSLIYNIKEKSKLIATLRTIGLSRNQLFKILFFQSTFFISLGLGLGILNSLFVSPLVIFGVNRNAFGWTLEFHYPVTELIYLLFIIPGTALLVSIYPYLEAKSKTIREALNYE
jgi:putative ABC transport system permease protein